ncbi:hypothetical protein M8J77_004236 [Diaphorina citri]|nr:hypothetical protein M8J77_004236 [Diaphorina citri]
MKMMTGVPSNFVTDDAQGGNSVNNIDSKVVPPTQQLHVQDRWSNVKLMPEVQHRAPRRETSIPVSSSTHQPGRHHTLDGPNGGGTLP